MTSGHPFLDRLGRALRQGIEDARNALEVVALEEIKIQQGKARAYREIEALVTETAKNWLADDANSQEP